MTKQLTFTYDGQVHQLWRAINEETGVHSYRWRYPNGAWNFWTSPNSRQLPGGPIDWSLTPWRKTMGKPRLKAAIYISMLITNTPEGLWQ